MSSLLKKPWFKKAKRATTKNKKRDSYLTRLINGEITITPSVNCPSNVVKDDPEECPVCYHTLNPTRNIAITECGHKFCFNCIARCIKSNNSCPICREKLDKHSAPRQNFTHDAAINLIQQATRDILENRASQNAGNVRRRLDFDSVNTHYSYDENGIGDEIVDDFGNVIDFEISQGVLEAD